MEYDVLGFTPLEYYFFNVEDRYGHYVDKLGDSRDPKFSLSTGTVRPFSKIYTMNPDKFKESIYWTDKYLHTLMGQANLTEKVKKILDALYQDKDPDIG